MTVELNYQIHGEGEPVLVLHGLFGSGRNWSRIAKQLSSHFQIITIDLRNHGNSGHNAIMRYPEMATDVINLAERLGLNTFNIIGHSMGGKTAMAASLLYPDKISNLVVVDIAPADYPTNHDDLISIMLSLPVHEIDNRKRADELLAEQIPDPILRQFLLQNLVKDGDNYTWRINLKAIQENHAHLKQFPKDFKTLSYHGPALFLSGSLSDYVKPEHGDTISGYFPQHEHIAVEDANHWVHADKPEEVIEIVLNHLGNTSNK
ncbi:MAG: alpha/beta fold hydrolase [Gammaproteobacteria bacterium]|nr:alpha/beta fold hydrolase [Gammaproteobacteria bacterium]